MIRRRASISLIALIMLLVFLLGLTLQRLDKAERDRKQISAALAMSQDSIVNKLAEFFAPIIAAEQAALEAGKTPTTRIETVIEKLQGIDPKLIQDAVKKAYDEVVKQQQAKGATTTTSSTTPQTSTTTSTSTSSSTSSTTTTRPPTTTSTTAPKPCTIGLNVPGLAKVCL